MHERPRRPLSHRVGTALQRCSGRLAHRTGTLLLAALTLGLVAAAALVVPGLAHPRTAAGPRSVATVDAAAQQQLQGAAAAHAGRKHGDHRKKQAADAPQAANANCSLLVPADPLSAQGLATPYQLVATDPQAGACHEANTDQSAFVEAAIYDPTQHTVSVYHPLVVDKGDRPAVPPTPVSLPTGAVVGVWFGYNGDGLTLTGAGAGRCVNGLDGSIFGQFAYCGADAFFAAANADSTLIGSIPALGQALDGKPCPTTRDFSVVDQDQSDNLATAYRVVGGRMAQLTPATLKRGTPVTNGSDEGLLAKAIDPALGCTPWKGVDLNNPGTPTPALALNELSAAKWQATPQALVPTTDPMVMVGDRKSTRKTNLYRAGVDMGPLDPAVETPQAYCQGIETVAPARITANSQRLLAAASPTPDQPNLLAFLQDRLSGTLDMLGCANAKQAAAAAGRVAKQAAKQAAGASPATQDTAVQGTTTQGTTTQGTTTQGTTTQGTTTQGTTTQGTTTQGTTTPATSRATTGQAATSSPAPTGTAATSTPATASTGTTGAAGTTATR